MNYENVLSFIQRLAVSLTVIGLIGTASIMVAQKPANLGAVKPEPKINHTQTPQTANSASDFTGDNLNDIVLFHADTANWTVHNVADSTEETFAFGVPFGAPMADDYDGDNVADIAMVRPDGDELCWEIRKSGGGTASIDWGLTSDVPVKGDFDGDGQADVAVWRQETGEWLVLASGSGELIVLQLGYDSDKAVPGDYDGDGITDAAVFRAETATFYFIGSLDQMRHAFSWDVPVLAYDTTYAPADYDGDGITDLAIFTEKDGQYRIFQSATGSFRMEQFSVGPRTCSDIERGDCSQHEFAQPADYDNDGIADPAAWNNVSGRLQIVGSLSGAVELTTETGPGVMTVSVYGTVR
jgi:hypothetical protein